MFPRRRRTLAFFTRWLALPLLAIVATIVWLTIDPGFRIGRLGSDAAPQVAQDEFQRRVRDYLLDNPEVIVEAMQRLEDRRRAVEVTETQVVLKSRADEVLRDPESPVGGNPEGDVTVVEFFDYNCPYCRQMAPVLSEAQASDPLLRIVYKEIPILGPKSVFAAKAALAAHRQGLYVKFHKALMHARGSADEGSVLRVAAEIGLDVARLKSDMEDAAIQSAIDRNLALARVLRITGTPAFVVGDKILPGATNLETLRTLIKAARMKQ